MFDECVLELWPENGHQRALNQLNKCFLAYFISGTALTCPLDWGNIWFARIWQLSQDFWDGLYNVTLYLNSTVLHFQLGRAGAGARGPRRSVRQRGDIQDLQAGITHPHHRRHHCQPPSKYTFTLLSKPHPPRMWWALIRSYVKNS